MTDDTQTEDIRDWDEDGPIVTDDEFTNMLLVLGDDVKPWSTNDDPIKTQTERRSFIRGMFALIEGIVFAMKFDALEIHREGRVEFSPEDVLLLSDKTVEIDRNGFSMTSTKFIPLKPNIKLAFRVYCKSHAIDNAIDVTDPGWDCLMKSIEVRNRLMHPKKAHDLTVTDDEVKAARSGLRWFTKSLQGVLTASARTFAAWLEEEKKKVEILRQQRDEAKSRLEALQEEVRKVQAQLDLAKASETHGNPPNR